MVRALKNWGFIKSKEVEEAMLTINRALFTDRPFDDAPQPIGCGQTISAPSVVALMLELLEVKKGMKVLEIGTGSGYNAALLGVLVGERGKVISIEYFEELAKKAEVKIKALGMKNVKIIAGDGSKGYEKEAPYDRIIVTAAMPSLSKEHPLIKQLKEGGRLVAPVGDKYLQYIVVYDKKSDEFRRSIPVLFVPLLGEKGFSK